MQRREFLKGSAAVATNALIGNKLLHEISHTATLRSLVRPDIRIGAQATYADLQNGQFASFVASHFNTLTAGHELKWSALRPSPAAYNFERADWMVDFAERNALRFHGHNLCWNHWLPGWVANTLTRSNAERYLVDHIATVAGRYKGRIDSWDVVNEPLGTWYNRMTGQPPRPWLDLIGPEYIDIAFHATMAADPKALRVLNFDRLEQAITGTEDDHARALTLIQGLVRRKVPIQAVGFESHLLSWDQTHCDSQDRLIRSIRDLGLKILITELDVNDTRLTGSIAERDQAVATIYGDYLKRMVPRMACEQVILWTPWDGSDWLDECHGRDYDRTDGGHHRPGLLGEKMELKPAFYSVRHALQQLFGGTADSTVS